MKTNRVQIVLACVAVLGAAVLAEVLQPRELMARTAASPSLDSVIPRQFGTWTLVPEISPVKPTDTEDYVEPDPLTGKVYTQEVGRGYSDGHGNIVMLLVAYGPTDPRFATRRTASASPRKPRPLSTTRMALLPSMSSA